MPDILLSAAPYLAIVLFLILTGAGLPIPEEAFVISAGVASSVGHLDPWLALACCLIGALLGDSLVYAIGFRFGRRVLLDRPWCARFLPPERERRIEDLILRHGLKMFLATRFLIGLRSPIYLTAGILRVPYRRFLIADACSAALIVGLFFGLGYHFGEPIGRWIRGGQWGLTIIVVAAVTCAGCVLWWRRRKAAAHDRRTTEMAARSSVRAAATRRPTPNPPDATEPQRRPAPPQLDRDPLPDQEKPSLR